MGIAVRWGKKGGGKSSKDYESNGEGRNEEVTGAWGWGRGDGGMQTVAGEEKGGIVDDGSSKDGGSGKEEE